MFGIQIGNDKNKLRSNMCEGREGTKNKQSYYTSSHIHIVHTTQSHLSSFVIYKNISAIHLLVRENLGASTVLGAAHFAALQSTPQGKQ